MEKHRRFRRPYTGTVQNFLVVWLDENIDEENNTDCQNAITKLREVVNSVNTFTDIDECVNFITDIKVEKVFMISSGFLDHATVSIVCDMIQISSIYIFCENENQHKEWTQHWPKVKGVFTDIKSICQALKKAVQECDRNTISMSFVATNGDTTNKNLNKLDQFFMYTQILKEILLTIDFESQHFEEFIRYCREQFDGNPIDLNNIDKFKREYPLHEPIWWYTYPSFLFSMLNRALRIMDIELIIKLGFFVRDLYQHITRLHAEQYGGHTDPTSIIVYRGQGLSQTDFDRFLNTKNSLLSFNNFLSTSLDRPVSLAFAESILNDPHLIGVLFRITVDSSFSSTPFADVRHVSYFEDEKEILFSMHSIFRIGKIQKIDGNNRLWQVELALTGDHDPQIHALTEHIRQETFAGYKGWYRLGYLLIKLGHFDKAQQVYAIMLTQTSDDRDRANIYHMLGMVKDSQGEYAEAITFYEDSNKTFQKILSPDNSDLANSYSNIAGMYHKIAEYSKALSSYEKALEIYKKAHPANHPDLAAFYNNIGVVYEKMDEYAKALSSHEKALEIRQKILPPNHPGLAESYNNTGTLYCKMRKYSDACLFYNRALRILQSSLPANHPNLLTLHTNIDAVEKKL